MYLIDLVKICLINILYYICYKYNKIINKFYNYFLIQIIDKEFNMKYQKKIYKLL